MDIVGITFDEEMKGYLSVETVKISKWIDPTDLSLDVIFRFTIEHKYKDYNLKKLRKFYVYFRDEDFESIRIDRLTLRQKRKRLEKSLSERSRERKLEEGISPLEGYIYPILTENLVIEDNGENKRIRVDLLDYNLTEDTLKRNILFTLKFKESIFSYDSIKPEPPKASKTWYYDCLIEPYLIQTLKWSKVEFMPLIESLELWLQIPEELYRTLSEVDVQPIGCFEQMFFLGKKMAEIFQKAGQPLAQEKTVCINWGFSDISMSSRAEEILVTCGLREFRVEERLARRFEASTEDFILVLRELLYKCKIQTLDIDLIIFNLSDRNVKKILGIFNTMVFHRNRRPMKENLDILLPELEHFKDLKHGEEFHSRYDIFHALIHCNRSEDFFSNEILWKLKHFDEFEDILDPEYKTLMKNFMTLVELTKKFNLYDMDKDKLRYKDETLSMIDKLNHQWIEVGKLTHPDGYVLLDILTNWKNVIEKEYREQVPKPNIKAAIKAKRLGIADTVGIVFSIENTGKGEASEVQARLLPHVDYEIITRESETKAYLTSEGRPFEPELVVKPKNEKKATILYEICFKNSVGQDSKNQSRETIEFIKEEIPFQKIENPYVIGDIVRDSRMFFGRDRLLEDTIENFRGKYQINPVFLYGQRRTGKTSTLIQLKKKLESEFAPVFFNTQEILGKKSFYRDFMEKIREELGFMDLEVPDIKEDPFDIFKERFYAEVKLRIKRRKVIIMIDEYQRIDEFISEGRYNDDIIDFLNALVQDGEIKFIFAGSLLPDELENDKWKELMKFFITMKVSFLERKDTIKLITEPVKGSIEYDEGGIEKIISLSGCHPYFVQLICHTMVEHHNHDEVILIGYNDVANHLSDYFERGLNVFSDIIEAQIDEIQCRILFFMYDLMEKNKRISAHRPDIEWNLMNYEKGIGKEEIENTLYHLEKREIIRKSAEHPDHYEFMIDLYRHWVKWNVRPK
jgi:hypothetical protein